MSNELIFKNDIVDALNEMGIRKGDVICLQANLENSRILHSYQLLIETIMEHIGNEGCLFIPSFTYSTLDPATKTMNYEFEDWEVLRQNMKGYQAKYSFSDVYEGLNSQMNMYKVSRSVHPVYSFTYWGSFLQEWLKQSMNYPVSFENALKVFSKGRAFNLLVGEKKENSVLVPAIAHTMNMGISQIERAYSMRNQKNVFHTYLNLFVNDQEKQKILDMCIIKNIKIKGENIHCISIENQ